MRTIEEASLILKVRHALTRQPWDGDIEARVWLDVLSEWSAVEVRFAVTQLARQRLTVTPYDVLDYLEAPAVRQRRIEEQTPRPTEPIPDEEKAKIRPLIEDLKRDQRSRGRRT